MTARVRASKAWIARLAAGHAKSKLARATKSSGLAARGVAHERTSAPAEIHDHCFGMERIAIAGSPILPDEASSPPGSEPRQRSFRHFHGVIDGLFVVRQGYERGLELCRRPVDSALDERAVPRSEARGVRVLGVGPRAHRA